MKQMTQFFLKGGSPTLRCRSTLITFPTNKNNYNLHLCIKISPIQFFPHGHKT